MNWVDSTAGFMSAVLATAPEFRRQLPATKALCQPRRHLRIVVQSEISCRSAFILFSSDDGLCCRVTLPTLCLLRQYLHVRTALAGRPRRRRARLPA
jgi:hypothetical protein